MRHPLPSNVHPKSFLFFRRGARTGLRLKMGLLYCFITLQLPSSEQKVSIKKMNAPKSQTPSPVCLSTHILDKAAEPQEMRSHPASRHRPLGAERSTFAVKIFSEERDDTASWARLTIVDETRRYKIAPMASVRTGDLERLTFRKAAGDPEDVLPRETLWTLKG